ncbi:MULTISPECIES: hypothetical protein [Exiguobacterium]|uniref:hypothetical protein n=1 Tax=Exiguobacterium TaxID=33986 RepID=UPI0008776615|nr:MULTISPECIES: hypothetical protein [Exiguobacterium]TCI34624.1 hypothetical protein EVJ29_12220 [Exiguobacterium sp. SH4S7]TCI44377.1 hypothetical protein EVJ31_11030 [Exiguobacterium sp. SH5S32]TCI50641.1 hypothetical protein EVJ25_11990 [Exiguobacterium sp. SH1S4]TCI51195.1 hypothetical protein EVJ24_13815 [Exiguobacterium sp. SH1S21]TCI60698.1 hypothetical protein EVJ21_12065 [Exiguobacterium sp. SH0S2]
METTHYIRISPEVWVSFGQDPEMILDWLLHVHEQHRDTYETLTLPNIERFQQILGQIEVYIDGNDTYNLEMAVIGEELVVNEKQAVVVGILTPQLLHIVKDAMNAFKKEDVGEMALVNRDSLDDIWLKWTLLKRFCDEASERDELVLIYYE